MRKKAVCYYSSLSLGFKIIEDRSGVRFIQTWSFRPVYSASAFTFPFLPVNFIEDAGQAVFMNWGLIPLPHPDVPANFFVPASQGMVEESGREKKTL
jgi:hypothetical protein